MKLSYIGERGLIRQLTSFLEIGDDAACIKDKDGFLVLTTDMIYEKTHVLPGMSYRDIGRFIVNVNASDVAAMGGKPLAFLLSCGLPDIEIKDFEELARAVDLECKRLGMQYAGGDTKQTDELTLAGFCIGRVKKPVLRSGAKAGDVVAVTGTLGSASIGTEVLLKKRDTKGFRSVIEKAMRPEARVKEGMILEKYATSMTDLSDGLAVGLHNISAASGAGLKISLEKIPIDPKGREFAETYRMDVTEKALYGGGDYELLFTVPRKDYSKAAALVGATEIGVVSGKSVSLITEGKESFLENRGFEHFRQKR